MGKNLATYWKRENIKACHSKSLLTLDVSIGREGQTVLFVFKLHFKLFLSCFSNRKKITILPYSPVVPLLHKKPGSTWLWLRHSVLWVGARGSASLVWAKTVPQRIRNGNDRCKKCENLTLLCHFTGERDNPRKEDGGIDKTDRGGLLGWGRNHQQQRQSWLILAAGVRGLTQHTLNCIPYEI